MKIHSSFIQSVKLNNEFKAIFELMQCSAFDPSIQSRFFIFRRRLFIEKSVLQKNSANINQGNKIDPLLGYKYEKLYQRFTKFQYLAANSALGFWRELL